MVKMIFGFTFIEFKVATNNGGDNIFESKDLSNVSLNAFDNNCN